MRMVIRRGRLMRGAGDDHLSRYADSDCASFDFSMRERISAYCRSTAYLDARAYRGVGTEKGKLFYHAAGADAHARACLRKVPYLGIVSY